MPRPPLRKGLGQHHLREGALCRPLVEHLDPRGQRVLEIGSGGGVLTRELIAAGARVVALELDPAWALRTRRVAPSARVAVADVLDLDWGRLPAPTLVAGNLPYGIGTRIVEVMLTSAPGVPRAAFLLQREVVDRLVAGPGDAAYGSLSVIVATYAGAARLAIVRPGSFVPPPKVESAFVGLVRRPPPLPDDALPAFVATVRAAFAYRRKTLLRSLAAAWGREKAAAVLAAAGLEPGARAESLGLDAFVALEQARSRLGGEMRPET